jgi:histidine triad (HIT) family protein
MDCIFCKIAAGEIPARFAHRDDDVIVVSDVNPQAPEHLLVIPVKHYENMSDFVSAAPPEVVAKFFSIAGQLGREQSASGFRMVVNQGEDGGQTVPHMHAHVLAGRLMHWPPG